MVKSLGVDAGDKIPLILTPYAIENSGNIRLDNGATLTVMLDQAEFKHSRQISDPTSQTLGLDEGDSKFGASDSDTVEIKLTFDGIAAAPPRPGQSDDDVAVQIRKLKDVVYKCDGVEHEPSHVRLLWRSLMLFGRLKWMTIDYSLFKPSGDPLRAVIDLRFSGFLSNDEAAIHNTDDVRR